MTFQKNGSGYILRFDKGEELVRTLTQFCAEQDIKAGWLNGLGGALWADVAFYHLERKAYEYDRLDEPLEIASLTGNITEVNGKPYAHIHAVLTDMDYHAYGGHLKELMVAGTVEIYLQTLEQPIARVHNDSVGLKTLDL